MSERTLTGDAAARARETADFVRELARDVTPVERLARLRGGVLRVLAPWGVLALGALALKGVSATFADPARWASGFGAVLAGLSLVGVGGVVAALATAVPGREATARAASALVALGLLVSVGLGGFLLHGDPATASPASVGSDLRCLVLAFAIALLPMAGALLYVARAAPAHPAVALATVGAGCVALGALTAQIGCTDPAFRHVLVSHALAPAIGAAVLFAPLRLAFRRLRAG
ncbi:MAG TPA: NrsF family protein [Myxococcota bacterium]|nr:NrsF family protein [Myxococcota bacterium]